MDPINQKIDLAYLEATQFTGASSIDQVVPQDVRALINQNKELTVSSFEQLRAKAFAVGGTALPFAIVALGGIAIYKAALVPFAISGVVKLAKSISASAKHLFPILTNSPKNIAASLGGIGLVALILTRPSIKDGLSSFFESVYGTLITLGTKIAGYFNVTENYNALYAKYNFTAREGKISSNNDAILRLLKQTYNEVAIQLNDAIRGKTLENDAEFIAQFQEKTKALGVKLNVIDNIFKNYGLTIDQSTNIFSDLSAAVRDIGSIGKQ